MKTENLSRTLEEVLQSTSDTLFPAGMGKQEVKVDSVDSDGDTALHVIAGRNDALGVELLIEAGAKIDAIGDMGETPLHSALRNNAIKSMGVLLFNRARTDIKSEFGASAREIAKEKGGQIEKAFRQYRRN